MVRSRAVRENSQNLTMEDCDKLFRAPHDPTATVRTVLLKVYVQE